MLSLKRQLREVGGKAEVKMHGLLGIQKYRTLLFTKQTVVNSSKIVNSTIKLLSTM